MARAPPPPEDGAVTVTEAEPVAEPLVAVMVWEPAVAGAV